METTWDFVEKYYPDYHRSEEITLSDDLEKILKEEWEEGDSSHTILVEYYNNDPKDENIGIDYCLVMSRIYEKSIENYIKTKKPLWKFLYSH